MAWFQRDIARKRVLDVFPVAVCLVIVRTSLQVLRLSKVNELSLHHMTAGQCDLWPRDGIPFPYLEKSQTKHLSNVFWFQSYFHPFLTMPHVNIVLSILFRWPDLTYLGVECFRWSVRVNVQQLKANILLLSVVPSTDPDLASSHHGRNDVKLK